MQFSWLVPSRLWLVTNQQACKPRTVPQVVGEVAQHGIDVVVLRDNISSTPERRRLGALVHEKCVNAGIPFAVAHDLELALQLNAQAIHLGKGDQSIGQTREVVGGNVAIGYSCHSVLEARNAMMQGADYVFLGPIFPSPEKLKFGTPLGKDVIAPALELPGTVVFIGGMDEETIPAALGQGAQRFAAIRAFQTGNNLPQRVASLAKLVAKHGA